MANEGNGPTGSSLAPDVRRALGPALLGFLALVLLAVLNILFRDDWDGSFAALLVVALVIASLGTMIDSGFRAAKALRSKPMDSGTGKSAVRMAVVLAAVLAVMTLTLGLLAVTDTWEGDSEPFIGIWVALALAVSAVAAFAPEPGRRGLLVLPFMLGVAAFVLLFSEVTGIT